MMYALGEEKIHLKDIQDAAYHNKDEFVTMIYSTFVKEKEAIIVYVNELVQFAAKC